MIRLLKSALVLFIGLHALFYALQNIANLAAAHGALVYVLSGADHEIYPATLFFRLNNPAFAWAALALVLIGELAVAYFGIKGGWDLFKARESSSEEFHSAKRNGIIAASIALLVWFGFFMSFGAAFFQMWQTQAGAGSMEGAFMYAVASAVTMMFVTVTED
jgi:predicted small integral membrane protein